MKRLFPFVLLLCALPMLAQGPPLYLGAYTGNAVVQPGTPPFNSSSPINTTVRESVLSNYVIARMTDPNDPLCKPTDAHDWHATKSGGSTDVITNANASLLAITCSSGATFVTEFNETALQRYPTTVSSLAQCGGPETFSRNLSNAGVWRCIPTKNTITPIGTANGTTVYNLTFNLDAVGNHCGLGIGNCYDVTVSPTWTSYFDFSTCAQAPAGAPQSTSQLGSGTDESVSQSFSWTGQQNTSHLFMQYIPGTGCAVIDTVGDGTHPIRYPAAGGSPVTLTSVNASFYIHDSYTVGAYAEISISSAIGGCTGNDCPCIPTYCPNPSNAPDGPALWQVDTNNLQITAKFPTPTGHGDHTNSSYYNANNPTPKQRPLSNLNSTTTLATMSCSPCEDNHLLASVAHDTWPLLGSRGGVANQTWTTPLMSEVYGIDSTGLGTLFRFSPTWSSGTTICDFECQYGIGSSSATRRSFFFSSDMLGQTGTISGPLNRSDIYVVGIAGQLALGTSITGASYSGSSIN